MVLWIMGTAALCPNCSTVPIKISGMRLSGGLWASESSPHCPQAVVKTGVPVAKMARRVGIVGKTRGWNLVREVIPWFILLPFHRSVPTQAVVTGIGGAWNGCIYISCRTLPAKRLK
jgi:hypothetical protein